MRLELLGLATVYCFAAAIVSAQGPSAAGRDDTVGVQGARSSHDKGRTVPHRPAAKRDSIWIANWPSAERGKATGDSISIANWPDERWWKEWELVITSGVSAISALAAALLAGSLSFRASERIYRTTRRDQERDQERERDTRRVARLQEVYSLSTALCDEMRRVLQRAWGLVDLAAQGSRSRGPILMDAKENCLARLVQIVPAHWPIRDILGFYENVGLIAHHHNAALALPDLWEALGSKVLDLGWLVDQYRSTPDPIEKEMFYTQIQKHIAVGIAVGFATDKHGQMEQQYNVALAALSGLASELHLPLPADLIAISAAALERRREVAEEVEKRSLDEQVKLLLREWHKEKPKIKVTAHIEALGTKRHVLLKAEASPPMEEPVFVIGAGIEADGDKLDSSRLGPDFQMEQPRKVPPEGLQARVETVALARLVSELGHVGSVSLRGYYIDSLHYMHFSRPFQFDVGHNPQVGGE